MSVPISRAAAAVVGFLARYSSKATVAAYALDLCLLFEWCAAQGVDPLDVTRTHLELFARHLEDDRGNGPSSIHRRLSTIRGYYRIAEIDDYVDKSPATHLRLPRVYRDETTTLGLDRVELGAVIAAARASTPSDAASWLPSRRWGEPLLVTEPDERGGRVNGVRRRWDTLTPLERRRLVAPGGGSCLLAVKNGGGPFTAWASVFERTSDRIRARFEPRFPHVNPHRLRHSFSMRTLEYLVSGHYRQAAQLVKATGADEGPDAALVFYLSKADPLLVLRDLLGHSSVLTTEKYLKSRELHQTGEGTTVLRGLAA
jgi:integrase